MDETSLRAHTSIRPHAGPVMIPCDDTENRLRLVQNDDGDIFVSIIDADGKGLNKSVRICTYAGSGYSLKGDIRLHLLNVILSAERAGLGRW